MYERGELVEQLRLFDAWLSDTHGVSGKIGQQAADEIERLEAENTRLENINTELEEELEAVNELLKSQGVEVNSCIAQKDEAIRVLTSSGEGMVVINEKMNANNVRLREALGLCDCRCPSLYHSDVDRHESGDSCPVEKRVREAAGND